MCIHICIYSRLNYARNSAPENREMESEMRANLDTLAKLAREGVITIEHLEACKMKAELLDAKGPALPMLNVKWFRGGLLFEAHRLVYYSG